MKTRSWNFRFSVLLLACGATFVLTNAPEAGAVSRFLIKPRAIHKATAMKRNGGWSKLWGTSAHSTRTTQSSRFGTRLPRKTGSLTGAPPHKTGSLTVKTAPQSSQKTVTRPSPLQTPATKAYRATQKNIGHFAEPGSHPVNQALSRSSYGVTQKVTGATPVTGMSSDPTQAPTASSVFSRGGAADPSAAKNFAPPQLQTIPSTAVSAPALFSQPTVTSGRASI